MTTENTEHVFTDEELIEAVRYLESNQGHIKILIQGFTVTVPSVRISESLILLARHCAKKQAGNDQ